MKKTKVKESNSPYYRFEKACLYFNDKGRDRSTESDVWVLKLLDILELRDLFLQKYGASSYMVEFGNKYPLYRNLLGAFEDTKAGGDRDLLEAALVSSGDVVKIAEMLNVERFDSLFLSLYRELFYNVREILNSPTLTFRYLILPATKANSDQLAIGHIWKVLALTGGPLMLKRKGFGSEAIKAEDLAYLLQIASYRNCSMILQYASTGKDFFADNPVLGNVVTLLSDFDSIRGHGRRTDYLAEVKAVSKNNLSGLLRDEIKLLSMPDNLVEELATVDGQFQPDNPEAMESVKHTIYYESSGEENDD